MACLSVATDLGMGQPADYAMTTCVVAMRLGDALGFDTPTLHDVYYETLLRYVGCNADTYWFASLFGDELAFKAEYAGDRHCGHASGAGSGASLGSTGSLRR